MLEMRHVTKIFNPGTVDEKIALNDLSFTLNDGDFVTVIGGNGAGKSTMQNAICGTWLPDAGRYFWMGSTSPPCRSTSGPSIWAGCIRTP